MSKKRSVLLIFILLFSSSTLFVDAFAHSMFNSSEKFEAGYRVQVATLPEFPQIGEPSQFRVKVTEGFDYEDVDRFRMGIRVYFNEQLVDTIPPKSIEGAYWDFDYVWRNQGIHIIKVDLYDMKDTQGVITYIFNMGTQSPFGYIFFTAITVGAMGLAIVAGIIYLPKKFKKFKL